MVRLPASVLVVASRAYYDRNRYRKLVETGGYLIADVASPGRIAAATGPGSRSEHGPDSVAIDRAEFQDTVAREGYTLCGDWHVHFRFRGGTDPSPDDRAAWRYELDHTDAPEWVGLIALRSEHAWEEVAGYVTTRDGCERAKVLSTLDDRDRQLLAPQVARSALLAPPATWQAGKLRQDIGALDDDAAGLKRLRARELERNLAERGFHADLRPLEPRNRTEEEPAALRRDFGRVLGIR